MKVALVTGSVPPAVCGVGDYTFHLAKALRQAQVEAEIITQDNWGALDSWPLLALVGNSKADIVHIQYPTVGYRFGFAPHLLSVFCNSPIVITLHEFKYAHILRRASCAIYSLRSKHTIFPNVEDRQSFCKAYFVPARKTSVIPLGSSIPWISGPVKVGIRISYFGIIRPAKGIEDFIEIGKLVKDRGLPFILEIIGSPAASNMAYYQSLREATASLPIEWSINLGPEEVASHLRESTCAYLPFPGGVSMRRSSLVAVMGNGVPVVTTDGPDRPPEMAKAMRFASNPEEALSVIVCLMNDPAQAETIVAEARKYLVDFSWPKIAEDHKTVYDRVLQRGEQFGYA